MATDDDEPPPPAPTTPRATTPEATGGGRKKDAAAPTSLTAPRFPLVDRIDPLLPDQLRRHEEPAEQALRDHHTIVRIARHPEQDPSWPLIIEALRQAEYDYRELNIVARARYEKQRRFRDLTSRLDMTQLENIKAADDAEGSLQDAWLIWRRVFATYRQIHQAVNPRRGMPDEVVAPPAQPDPYPSPGGAG